MALSGTLELFSLADVLRLVSGSHKSGALSVEAEGLHAVVWVRDGRLVGAELNGGRETAETVVFQLLRLAEGEFSFHGDQDVDVADFDSDVEQVLAAAQALLEEWHEIASVVAGTHVHVRLRPEVDDDAIITPAQWSILASIGAGTTVGRIGSQLDLTDFDSCRRVAELVTAGLLDASEDAPPLGIAELSGLLEAGERRASDLTSGPATPGTTADSTAGTMDPVAADDDPESGAAPVDDDSLELSPVDHPVAETPAEPGTIHDGIEIFEVSVVSGPAPDPVVLERAVVGNPTADTGEPEEVDVIDDSDDDPFLAQLSQLSPKAAAAIEATATTDDRTDSEPSGSFIDFLVPEDARGQAVEESSDEPETDTEPTVEADVVSADDEGTVDDADDVGPDEAAAVADDGGVDQNLLRRFLASTQP